MAKYLNDINYFANLRWKKLSKILKIEFLSRKETKQRLKVS